MVKLLGYSFFEPPAPKVPLWREILNAIPKVQKPVPKMDYWEERKWLAYALAGGLSLALVMKYRKKIGSLLPGFQRVRTALGCEPPVVPKSQIFDDRKKCFESVRSGSLEEPLLTPKCQILVGEMIGGEFNAVGSAVRMRDYLVMPAHVYAAVDRPALKGRQHWIYLDKDRDYVDLDTDLIAFKMTEKELSTIGVTQSSISHALPYSGDFVSVVGLQGKGTVGELKHDRLVFGRVTYKGTTVAGYSGAGYMSGNRLVGIHTNGGATNGGYSASYVYSLICMNDRIKNEDSEDWLRKMYTTKKKRFRIDKRWADLDEVRVEVDGRYAVVSRGAMAAAFGNDYEDQFDAMDEPYVSTMDPRDYESIIGPKHPPAGEAKASSSGGSSVLDNSPDQDIQEVLALKKVLDGFSKKRLISLASHLQQFSNDTSTRPESVAIPARRNT